MESVTILVGHCSDQDTGWAVVTRFLSLSLSLSLSLCSPQRSDRLWNPPSLLCNGYRDFLLGRRAASI